MNEYLKEIKNRWKCTLDLLTEDNDMPLGLFIRYYPRETEIFLVSSDSETQLAEGSRFPGAITENDLGEIIGRGIFHRIIDYKGLNGELELFGKPEGYTNLCGFSVEYEGRLFGLLCLISRETITLDDRKERQFRYFKEMLEWDLRTHYVEEDEKVILADQRWLTDASLKILTELPQEKIFDYLLSYLLERTAADRAYLFRFDWDKGSMSNTNEIVREGISPQIGNLQEIDISGMEYFINDLKKDHIHHISCLESIPSEAGEARDILAAQDIGSLIFAPILEKDALVGYIGLDWNGKSRSCSSREKQLMRSASYLISLAREKEQFKEEILAAREKAEKNDRLKSEFLSDISHEIRNPINAIVGFSRIIADSAGGDFARYADLIQDNRRQLMDMISSILEFTRTESRQTDLKYERIPVGNLVEDLYRTHEINMPKGVSLVKHIECPPGFTLTTDGSRVKQILANFLTNAAKHTETGEIKLECRLAHEESCLELCVADTGSGIPREKQEAVFERFIKLNSMKEGTGLGLTISRSLAESLGGRIALESEPGRGSAFTLILPLDQARASA